MRSITTSHGRKHPRESSLEIYEGDEKGKGDLRNLERVAEKVRRDIVELDDSIPGDVRDRVVLASRGAGQEVKIRHSLPARPTDFYVLNQTGSGSIWQSRNSLSDDEFMYFRTDANTGVKFKVVPVILEPVHGKGPDAFESLEQTAEDQEQEEPTLTSGGKAPKKPGFQF